jgi:hypothetical protein
MEYKPHPEALACPALRISVLVFPALGTPANSTTKVGRFAALNSIANRSANGRLLAKSQEARPGAERWRSFAYARAAAERR